MAMFDLIVDGFTDEHSGFGVPPFVNTHPRYLAAALTHVGRAWEYLTIDDVRFAASSTRPSYEDTCRDKSMRNTTRNRDRAGELLQAAQTIYAIAGRFVDYAYASAVPARPEELGPLLAPFPGRKVLIYAISTVGDRGDEILSDYGRCHFAGATTLPAHEYVLGHPVSYAELALFCPDGAEVLGRISNEYIVEIETAHGCNWKPGCTFCIEAARKEAPVYRPVDDILAEVRACYAQGARRFRLGRQPNLFNYMGGDPDSMRALLEGIRESCPALATLHIDNTSPQDIVTKGGRAIARHIVTYCTSGNIGSLGVESFDPEVRTRSRLNSNPAEITEAIAVLNDLGGRRGPTGLPALLPGLNLIHGLPGQREDTLKYNLDQLQQLLDAGLMTRRTFVRGLTDATGFMGDESKRYLLQQETLEYWQQAVERAYTLPMLRRVAPKGLLLRDVRSELWTDTGTLLRQIGTCPIRILADNVRIPLNSHVDIRVDEHVDGRTVRGTVVDT